jgi:hypothetical protein
MVVNIFTIRVYRQDLISTFVLMTSRRNADEGDRAAREQRLSGILFERRVC